MVQAIDVNLLAVYSSGPGWSMRWDWLNQG